jgi:hypothetical protein
MKDSSQGPPGIASRIAVLLVVFSSIFIIICHFKPTITYSLIGDISRGYISPFSNQLIARNRDHEENLRNLSDAKTQDIDIAHAKKLAQDLLGLIRARYQLDEPIGRHFFNTANNIGNNHWDILKYKFAVKILEEKSTFLMVFGGSSGISF